MNKLYLAYGSNLSVRQMLSRCPGAIYVGTASIPSTRLVFRGSGTGHFLSIEPAAEGEDREVPCLVWRINRENEKSLDTYEGYPRFYLKQEYTDLPLLSLLDGSVGPVISAMAYQLPTDAPAGLPSFFYYDVCLGGYKTFGFPPRVLQQALVDSVGAEQARLYRDAFKQAKLQGMAGR